jgi:hypothetical protein
VEWVDLSVIQDFGKPGGLPCASCKQLITGQLSFPARYSKGQALILSRVANTTVETLRDHPYEVGFCRDCKEGVNTYIEVFK